MTARIRRPLGLRLATGMSLSLSALIVLTARSLPEAFLFLALLNWIAFIATIILGVVWVGQHPGSMAFNRRFAAVLITFALAGVLRWAVIAA